ncbi:MAG: hypothetical protein L0154_25250 [Chloroflexi bacterium]|nr:hypothetical protein [Chloroflexota bacterium]
MKIKSLLITIIAILTALPAAYAQGPDDLADAQAFWASQQPEYYEIVMSVEYTDNSEDEPQEYTFTISLFVDHASVKSATVWCEEACPDLEILPPEYISDAILTALETAGEDSAFEVDEEFGYVSMAVIATGDRTLVIEAIDFAEVDAEAESSANILDNRDDLELVEFELEGKDTDTIPELTEEFDNYFIAYDQISIWFAFDVEAVVMDGQVVAMSAACSPIAPLQPCMVWALDATTMTLEAMQERAEEALEVAYREDFSVLQADAATGILTRISFDEELAIDEEWVVNVTDFAVIEIEDE